MIWRLLDGTKLRPDSFAELPSLVDGLQDLYDGTENGDFRGKSGFDDRKLLRL